MKEIVIRKGGSFFLEDVPAEEVFTPEDFSEEHQMIIAPLKNSLKTK